MERIKKVSSLFKYAAIGFSNDNAFKLSASLSYYTIFAIGPLLIIIISLAGMVYGKVAVQGKIYLQLKGMIGNEAAMQIQDIIQNIQLSQTSTIGAIVGAIILVIAATGIFTEMQDSINYIWSVKAKPKKSWLKFLSNRLLSFLLVLGLGFLLLASLIISALFNFLSSQLIEIFPNYNLSFFHSVNSLIFFVVLTGLFGVIFKVLPDAIITWKDAMIGASLTAVLFLIGKLVIGYYLGKLNLGISYGTAASIIIILSWVYYSALILFFGAEFTKMFALQAGSGIRPKETAVFIIKRESKEVPDSYLDT
ncbi:MAG: YihY/virulence factor BrkB family protein [Bacteroidota bacterium]|nr:YihY/virulence factor BrkB family protein [Bacteroidota bacterium]